MPIQKNVSSIALKPEQKWVSECVCMCVFAHRRSAKKCHRSINKLRANSAFFHFTAGIIFETIEGGFLDIDITIKGPDGTVIYQGDRESSGKYAFAAHTNGIYTYCFSNKMSTVTPKTLMFTIEIGEPPKGTIGAVNEGEAGHTKLEDMIRELAGTLTGVKHEQEYMNVRDKIHREINESTNSRVVLWSTFEALILVVMTVGQVYYLKRYFEVRRVV